MKKMDFRRSNFLLILIFTIAGLLVFFIAGLTFKQLQKLNETNNLVYHSQKVSLDLQHLYANLKDIETERRNFILDSDLEGADSVIKDRLRENNVLVSNLHKELGRDPNQQKKLKELSALLTHKYNIVQETFSKNVTKDTPVEEVKKSLMAGKQVMATIKKTIDGMLAEEQTNLKKNRSEFLFSERFTPVYLYGIAILSLGVLGMAFYQTFRDLKIQKMANSELQLGLDKSLMAEDVGKYGVWTFDNESRSYHFSENLKKILGIPQAQEPGFAVIENKIPKEDWQIFQSDVKRVLTGADIEPRILRFTSDNGQVHYLANDMKLITEPKKMILGITRDVTKGVKDEENLASAYKDLQFYYSSSRAAERIGSYGFWRWTNKDDKYWFSDNLYHIFGLKNENYSDLTEMKKQVHPDDLNLVDEKIAQMYAGENVVDFTHRIYRSHDGALRYLKIVARKMDWDSHLNYLIITQDITDQVLANQHLEEQNRILDTNNRELQAFNYVASHDLQEPLRKIETFIGRLKDKDYDNLSDTGKIYLDKTRASAGRMRNLIDDLLQFSRSTRGDAVFEHCDLNQLFEEAKENLQTRIEQKNAVITAEELPELEVIPFQIKQLFTNLLSNSLKYSKEGVAPEIRITSEKIIAENENAIQHCSKGEYYKIVFKDNGIGFNNQYSEKIFQLFNRLHGKKEYEGTGIGLAICKKIVENHKGCIFAEGKENEGAMFTVYLPLKIS